MNAVRRLFRQNKLLVWLPFVLGYGGIFYLSSLDSNDLQGIEFGLENIDKVFHFIEFFVLGLLLFRSLYWVQKAHIRAFTWFYAILLITLLAFLDEYHQSFVPGRFVDFWDGVADVLGGWSGLSFGWLLYRFRFKKTS